ncbi:MAG TPA: hypothetical protein VJS12_00740 [Steroidobacteraceae bacterium]|nr:hypothetical protein [Steroidobacteraceae bacterium]
MSEADTNATQPASQKEPPVEGPEVHHPHKHHGGGLPRWLELSIAVTALITSVSSIVIAIHHGKTMEKLVQANSLPYMAAGVSDVTTEGAQILSLDILNRGVGPAHEKSLRVKVDGQYVASVDALIAASLTPAEVAEVQKARDDRVLVITKNNVKHRFVPGGAEQMIFRTIRTPENGRLWDLLDDAQKKWSIEFCYCSVFDECWYVANKWAEPEPVKQCTRDEPNEFTP